MTSFPSDWKIESLDSLINRGVIKLNRGDIISKRDIAAHPGDYPIFSSAKENNGMFGRYGKYMFDEEVITWSIDGGGRFFYREKQKFSVTNVGGILRIIDKSIFDYKFLFYALTNMHSQVIFDWSRKAHPSVIRLVYDKVPIPPLDEQHKIVELLEEHFSRLDAALDEVKQTKLKAAQFRNVYIEDFLKKPEGLKTNLASIAKFMSGFAYKSSVWQDAGIPVVKIMNVKNREVNLKGCSFVSPEVAENSKNFAVKKGDLLFNMTGATLGAFGFYNLEQEARMNQRVGKFVPLDSSEFNVNYLAYFLESASTQRMIQQLAKGAAQPNISPTDILSLEINLPDIAMQTEIVEELDAGLSKVTQVDQLCDLTEVESYALRRSLLQAAFTGELTKEVVSV